MHSATRKKSIVWTLLFCFGVLSTASVLYAEECRSYQQWAKGQSYSAGDRVVFQDRLYNRDQGKGCYGGLTLVTNTDSEPGAYTKATLAALGSSQNGGGSAKGSTAVKAQPAGITVYQNCRYGGYAVPLGAGRYNLAALKKLGLKNDDVSSLKVKSGYKATLYRNNKLSGASLIKKANDSCLINDGWNDQVSSIKVEKVNNGGDTGGNCAGPWYAARLTSYESYPDPGSEECIEYNGCTWAGWFYGLPDKKTEQWVAAHNIASVHLKDWDWLGLKTIRLRQGDKEITATVYDACSDSDCNGCCTENLGGDGYLIDIEKYTMQRFGSGDGIVEFQVCD